MQLAADRRRRPRCLARPTYWRPTDCRSAPSGRRSVGPPAALQRPRPLSGPFDQSLLTAVVDSVPAAQPWRRATRGVAYLPIDSMTSVPLYFAAAAAAAAAVYIIAVFLLLKQCKHYTIILKRLSLRNTDESPFFSAFLSNTTFSVV